MKPRKKLVSIALVILLICSMALPASAGSVEAVDRFEDCEFSMYTICNTHDFSSYMEFQHIYIPGSNKTYEDYSFRSEVLIYEAVGFGDGILLSTIPGTSSTMISSTRGSFTCTLHHVKANHYVNSTYIRSTSAYA